LIADAHSYEFAFGSLAEFATCATHGDYPRKIAPDQLTKLIDWCRKAEAINWIRATDIAYRESGDNTEAYSRQPGDVRIYNPENLPLSSILLKDTRLKDPTKGELIVKSLAFDSILCAGMTIYLPNYYSVKEQIVSGCPECNRSGARPPRKPTGSRERISPKLAPVACQAV
jgi:hypothetical protein